MGAYMLLFGSKFANSCFSLFICCHNCEETFTILILPGALQFGICNKTAIWNLQQDCLRAIDIIVPSGNTKRSNELSHHGLFIIHLQFNLTIVTLYVQNVFQNMTIKIAKDILDSKRL